jgi:hypothetical protein
MSAVAIMFVKPSTSTSAANPSGIGLARKMGTGKWSLTVLMYESDKTRAVLGCSCCRYSVLCATCPGAKIWPRVSGDYVLLLACCACLPLHPITSLYAIGWLHVQARCTRWQQWLLALLRHAGTW